jgi:hypothetical protein
MRLARLLLAVTAPALVLAIWVVATTPAHAQEPPVEAAPVATPAPSQPESDQGPGSGNPLDFLPDPREWVGEVFSHALVSLLRTISEGLRSLVGGVMSSSLNFVTQTPPAGSYASPTVLALWGAVRAIANAALVLVVLWGGFDLILRDHLGSPYHEAMELFPRAVLGALLANTSLTWAALAIDANNAISGVLGQASLPAWDRADTASQLLVDVISILIYLVTSLLLLLQMLMRLALIDVLLVVSPLALLCWVLPQTQGWARLWSGTFFSAVFAQFVQVLALKLGGALLTELTTVAADAALLAVFLGVAVLAVTMRIPSLMRNQLGDGLGFARYFAYRQAAGALGGRAGSARPPGGT